MAAICYSELDDPRFGKPNRGLSSFDPSKCNANKCYLKHYENVLTLTWWSNNGSMAEKKQAHIELEKARRSMDYWRRQPHFNQEEVTEEVAALKKRFGV